MLVGEGHSVLWDLLCYAGEGQWQQLINLRWYTSGSPREGLKLPEAGRG